MPGHRAGLAIPESIQGQLAFFDTTELSTTDDLHHPYGPARDAMVLAADCFGAAETLFLTNGSTVGILALLASMVGRRQKLILPRTCHVSVHHAIALLDIEPVWIEPTSCSVQPLAFLPVIDVAAVAKAIACAPDSRAIFLTSPDYYGTCADLAAIAQVTHRAGQLLLVDEAHGAHFAAAPEMLPQTALAAGADACVQSAHKTLSALTQGAYLHVS
ncbi:MAG: aminotransferase class I/II-fold pyridoxal phosphate-dependent enzyme, partial [Eubacteriales bacterium]|nr:aminotransferase class I/II-fold pyridoxal phosphate-dependent enzyme [Eubacteriales bacterium]